VADWYPTTLDKDEWDNLHHSSLTLADDWDPSTLNRELDDDDALTDEKVNAGRRAQANEVDYVFQRPTFGWLSVDIIQETSQYMTQYVHLPGSENLKTHYKSPFHALTVFRSDAPVEKQLAHVLALSSFNLRLGLSKLRLAPIDGESLRQFVKFKEISPRTSSPTDNIVDLYRSSPSPLPPKTILGCPSSSLLSPPKLMVVRPIKDPTDLIGWLFLKDQDNGECHRDEVSHLLGCERRHRDELSHLLGCEYPEPAIVSPILDPTDLIGWLFLKDQDNGERLSTSPPTGERSSPTAPSKTVIARPILNPADFIGWKGERHRDALSHLLGCECPKPTIVSSIIDPADLIGWLVTIVVNYQNGHRSGDPGKRGASSCPDDVSPLVRSSDH
jgi:hypothetical protein